MGREAIQRQLDWLASSGLILMPLPLID